MVHEIACQRDFYVHRSHMESTHFEPLNLTQNFRNHGYSTLCTITRSFDCPPSALNIVHLYSLRPSTLMPYDRL